MDKKALSERDICTKFITPALKDTCWDIKTQIKEEQTFTAGKILLWKINSTRKTTTHIYKSK